MTFILGINAYHGDVSACLIAQGRLVAAAEEERFRCIKHSAGFPSEAIKYCLAEAGIGLREVEHVAFNQDPRANRWRKIVYMLSPRPDPRFVHDDRLRNKQRRASEVAALERTLGAGFRGAERQVEHHLSDLSSAFHVLPLDEAVFFA